VTQPPDGYEYPQPYYAPGWQPQQPQQPQQPPWDGVSVAALATGVVGLGPVPVVLGLVGASRTAGQQRRGRWMAWTAVALGVASTLFWLALGGVVWLLLRPLPVDVASPRFATPQQLVVGNCVATVPADGEVWAVRVVPCADSHEAKVVLRQDLVNPPTGQLRLDAAAAQVCADVPTNGGRLVVWAPTPGHVTVTCLVTTPAGSASST
jgi:hypothetical protein